MGEATRQNQRKHRDHLYHHRLCKCSRWLHHQYCCAIWLDLGACLGVGAFHSNSQKSYMGTCLGHCDNIISFQNDFTDRGPEFHRFHHRLLPYSVVKWIECGQLQLCQIFERSTQRLLISRTIETEVIKGS